MRSNQPPIFLVTLVIIVGSLIAVTPLFAADKGQVLHKFRTGVYGVGRDGFLPYANLILDGGGNLYGTTAYGGHHQCAYNSGCGTIFQLTPGGNGQWTETVLHDFSYGTGYYPFDGLIFDAAGNLYGTTQGGGTYDAGTVFRLAPMAKGAWTYTVLYSFTGGNDGAYPSSSLIFDSAGNLYGTAGNGGAYGVGTVFQLAKGTNGKWTETVLHTFQHDGKDGIYPGTNLTLDAAGNLYGTTCCGGNQGSSCSPNDFGCGIVFELIPGSKGIWKERVLHNFNYKDGANSNAGLIFDGAGNLYGTTQWGGAFGPGCTLVGCGTVFELSPAGNGNWREKVLHRFNSKDGSSPNGSLLFDAAQNLYGTTFYGGANHPKCAYNCGIVFELTQNAKGEWTEKILHGFDRKDGAYPASSLVFDPLGNLYGTTQGGGAYVGRCDGEGCGTVFEITP